MSDKKNEDHVVRIPNGGSFDRSEKSSFMPRPAGMKSYGGHSGPSVLQSMSKLDNSPIVSILAYCASSISMTIVNKYVVSGQGWNLNFFYLTIQAIVCIGAITACKNMGLIKTLAPFETDRAKKWFPISVLLVGMIYTGAKALQFLSVPVYTIFKNLTIIVIAYGEVLWFGGNVTPLTLVSFGLMIVSSVIAAWADIQSAVAGDFGTGDSAVVVSTLNAGYAWMGLNVICSASYVLGMRKVMKKMNFKDWDSTF
jgi:GDP-mannose transporter